MTPETRTKSKIKEHLRQKQREMGARFWWDSLSQRYKSGLPDFIAIENGRAYFIEAKATDNILRPLQAHVAETLMKAGAKVYVGFLKNNRLCFEELTQTHLEVCKQKGRKTHAKKNRLSSRKHQSEDGGVPDDRVADGGLDEDL